MGSGQIQDRTAGMNLVSVKVFPQRAGVKSSSGG